MERISDYLGKHLLLHIVPPPSSLEPSSKQRLCRIRHRVAGQVILTVLVCTAVALTALTESLRQTLGITLLAGAFLI
ncbi:hypothetical protein ACWD26_24525 [Streptomyces sp. NPDC002787]